MTQASWSLMAGKKERPVKYISSWKMQFQWDLMLIKTLRLKNLTHVWGREQWKSSLELIAISYLDLGHFMQ